MAAMDGGAQQPTGDTKPAKRRLEISIAVKLNLKDMNELINEEEIVKDIVRKHLTPNAESETKVISDYIQERSHTWPRIDIGFKKDGDIVVPLTAEDAKKADQQTPDKVVNERNGKMQPTIINESRTGVNESLNEDDYFRKDAPVASSITSSEPRNEETPAARKDADIKNTAHKDTDIKNTARKDTDIKEVIQIEPRIDIAIPKRSIDLMPYSPQLESVTFDYGRHYGKIPTCNAVINNDEKETLVGESLNDKEINEGDFSKESELNGFENGILRKASVDEYVAADPIRNYAGPPESRVIVQSNGIKPTVLRNDKENCFLNDRSVIPDINAPKSENTFKSYNDNKSTAADINNKAHEKSKNLSIDVRNVFRKILPSCKVSYINTHGSNAKNSETHLSADDSKSADSALNTETTTADKSGVGGTLEKTLSLSKVKKHLRVEDDIQTINKHEDFAQSPLDYTLESEKSL